MTLVLLHSSGANPSLWDRVREHLAGIPLLVPALPGRAGVAWPEEERARDVAAYGRFVLAEMDRAGVDAATIAGHSLGGAIALQLALDHPDRVRGLGLVATGARLRVWPHVLETLADEVRDGLDVLANAQCGPKTPDRDRVALRRMLESTGTRTTYEDLAACDGFDVMERLSEIRCRTQIMAGAEDACTPPKYSAYLATHIAGARLTMFDEVGHAIPLERPEEVAGDLAVLWAAGSPRSNGASAGREGPTAAGSGGEGRRSER